MSLNYYDVLTLGANAKLFDNNHVVIVDSKAEIHQTYLVGGKRVPCHTDTLPLKSVFPNIRKLFDQSGIAIAERATPKSRLLSTGKGKTKPYHAPRELDVYWAIEANKKMKQ